MKASPEAYNAYLTLLLKTFSQTASARAMGISRGTARNWLMRSKRDAKAGLEETSDLYLEFEGKLKWYHQHVASTVKYSCELLEETLRHWAIFGTEKIVRDTRGQPVWKRDLKLVGRPDLQELAGVPDDLYRDKDGNVVAETIIERPPFDGAMKFLAAYVPRFRPGSDDKLSVNHHVAGGVMVIGQQHGAARKAAPMPELEVIEPRADDFDAEVAAAEPESPAPSAPNPAVNRAPTPMREELERIARKKDADRLAQMVQAGGMKVV